MDWKKLRKGCAVTVGLYMILSVIFYWIAADQLRFRDDETAAVIPVAAIGEVTRDTEIRQPFVSTADELTGVSMILSTYARENTANITIRILDMTGRILTEVKLSGTEIVDSEVRRIPFPQPISVESGAEYILTLTSPDGVPGNSVTGWYGDSMSASRNEVIIEIPERQKLVVNGEIRNALLSYSLWTRNYFWVGTYYWQIVFGIGILLVCFCLWIIRTAKNGKSSAVLRMIAAFQMYGYLLKQLVARDFKTKYKRSVLGVFWSFLNPLLTMLVQYFVFATLFKSDIQNFPLYLLTGIVCFNFFNEATSMALQSIVGNASLISKVYVPKYIYPVSRVLSSTINLALSMIPLLAVMLITSTPFRPALFLLPFGMICLIALSLGIGFILSTAMVFFRDTQFLWGVLSMLWMYMTPIFYPESIIPAKFMTLYKCNPMYHVVRFIRILLMDGISPEPKAYLLCIVASVFPLLIGMIIFKRNQDKFVLNL